MTFTPRKYKDIFDQMRAMTQVVTDFEVGSVARTMYESFAYELALLYEKMQLVYLSAYVDTAQGNQLDQVVAILGIVRSQPDYSEGVVTFQRDGAGQEIIIPLGTLVATEESSTGVKKVYQTSKEGTLAAVRTSVDVPVRAVERGEEFETAAETIVVMPRPVPGIKTVFNAEPIRLVGKRRETDEELRARAKNALISSGKATIISVENALLSLSGVRDARVKENFHFARATLRITRNVGSGVVTIPRGSRLKTTNFNLFFKTLDPVSFEDADLIGTVREIKVESLLEGQAGELILQGTEPMIWDNTSLQADYPGTLISSARLEDFGLIEVFVDAPRMEEGTEAEKAAERARIEAEIERVRAAGIFSILRPAGKVETSAVFKIDLNPQLSLTPEERKAFEENVEEEITQFLGELRMGKPLLYGKLVKEILSLDNIENLSDFQGTATRMVGNTPLAIPFTFSDPDKFIAVEEFERIQPRFICVASENKELKVHIAYQAANLDASAANAVRLQLETYFSGMTFGDTVSQNDLEDELDTALTAAMLTLTPSTLELRPETWCPGPDDDPRPVMFPQNGDIVVEATYVEKPTLGIVFGYAAELQITGAIKLILPLNITQADKDAVREKVLEEVEDYLATLGPEEDVTFEALALAAQSVNQVLAAEVDTDDFVVVVDGLEMPELIDNQKIDVGPLIRAKNAHLLVTGGTETVTVSRQNLTLTMGNPSATVPEREAVKLAVRNAFNNALAGFTPGDDVVYNAFRGNLENLVVGVPYTIAQLDLQASSPLDGRIQNTTLATPKDIHVRSVELAVISPIQVGDIVISN